MELEDHESMPIGTMRLTQFEQNDMENDPEKKNLLVSMKDRNIDKKTYIFQVKILRALYCSGSTS